MSEDKKTIFEMIGSREAIEKIHAIFYDKLYLHPILGQFFIGIDQKTIENQQTDFMIQNFGGPKNYCGQFPKPAHKHMFITEEQFQLRQELLKESIKEYGLSDEIVTRWLKIDGAFKDVIVKKSIDECEKRYFTDEIKKAI